MGGRRFQYRTLQPFFAYFFLFKHSGTPFLSCWQKVPGGQCSVLQVGLATLWQMGPAVPGRMTQRWPAPQVMSEQVLGRQTAAGTQGGPARTQNTFGVTSSQIELWLEQRRQTGVQRRPQARRQHRWPRAHWKSPTQVSFFGRPRQEERNSSAGQRPGRGRGTSQRGWPRQMRHRLPGGHVFP